MIRLLRRWSPRNPLLAMLYWLALVAGVLVALFLLFYSLDRYLPGGGMF
ncbi:MAG TPA: hypothetical protein VGB51_10180 [Actinomycetota bacterium]